MLQAPPIPLTLNHWLDLISFEDLVQPLNRLNPAEYAAAHRYLTNLPKFTGSTDFELVVRKLPDDSDPGEYNAYYYDVSERHLLTRQLSIPSHSFEETMAAHIACESFDDCSTAVSQVFDDLAQQIFHYFRQVDHLGLRIVR